MAQEEHAELVQPGFGDDVDDHATAGRMDADWEAVGEVPYGARVTLTDTDEGQVLSLDPKQRRQVRRLFLSGPEPHEVAVFHDRVKHHQSPDGVVQRHGLSQ